MRFIHKIVQPIITNIHKNPQIRTYSTAVKNIVENPNIFKCENEFNLHLKRGYETLFQWPSCGSKSFLIFNDMADDLLHVSNANKHFDSHMKWNSKLTQFKISNTKEHTNLDGLMEMEKIVKDNPNNINALEWVLEFYVKSGEMLSYIQKGNTDSGTHLITEKIMQIHNSLPATSLVKYQHIWLKASLQRLEYHLKNTFHLNSILESLKIYLTYSNNSQTVDELSTLIIKHYDRTKSRNSTSAIINMIVKSKKFPSESLMDLIKLNQSLAMPRLDEIYPTNPISTFLMATKFSQKENCSSKFTEFLN
ncbi:hypothetical protein DLAC_07488 [Tieghemostelium lacteum]|uniref:Uncharacterized protein n=1 Tax=Tieghemostelium lacteum TaxID=361077 RepID=A0A151ZCM9_TIELA|nr:hypothetical protein DLAC_07488 [Tieghemostelium lacteum]|eukprot:KYQ91707.1 hypothetical protein DLAC_07488 [Tieghemostelium lacteum]